MTDKNKILLLSKFEDEVLELIDNHEEFTRSDLQGIVMALVLKIYNEGGENKWK